MGDVPGRRVALITGGAVGLGRAIAHRLAADGLAVAIAYHAQPADAVVDDIRADGGEAMVVPLDATDPRRVHAAVEAVVARYGRLDVLVNNAGGLLARVAIGEMSDAHWDRVLTLNLSSAFYATRAAVPHLGRDGRIVNISSLAAEHGGGPGATAYASAKAGLIGFTRASAKELGPAGVTVNAIAPGYIADTPFHATFSSAEAQQAMITAAAVGRAGQPADIAALVAFLVSPGAGFISGAVVDVNGGSYFT